MGLQSRRGRLGAQAAERARRDAGFRVKVAIVALRAGVGVHDAAARLDAQRGSVRAALAALAGAG